MVSSLLACSLLAARAPARPNAARQLATRSPSLTLSRLRCADLQIPSAALLDCHALSLVSCSCSREKSQFWRFLRLDRVTALTRRESES